MEALVLEKTKTLSIREIDIREELGPEDVRIAVGRVGICGSDLHYYEHGAIGGFVVRSPMVLGHEASGTVIQVGSEVRTLKRNDRVCMEPGIPDPKSRAYRLGRYNLDPAVRFWATPPVHGVIRPEVVHPAAFTFRLPDSVSLEEGALVEPLAVGMHAVTQAGIKPGDTAVVNGAGTVGLLTALATLAGGCSRVIIADIVQSKLDLAAGLGPIVPVNVQSEDLKETVMRLTDGWGADLVFEASGSEKAFPGVFDLVCPGGTAVLIGIPGTPIPLDIAAAQTKELSIRTVFRYAHVYPRALALMEAGKIDVKPLITDTFGFRESIEAFEHAARRTPESVKTQIRIGE